MQRIRKNKRKESKFRKEGGCGILEERYECSGGEWRKKNICWTDRPSIQELEQIKQLL